MNAILSTIKSLDYVDYSPTSRKLVITRNPYGFVTHSDSNAYEGINEINFNGMYYRRDIGYQVRKF